MVSTQVLGARHRKKTGVLSEEDKREDSGEMMNGMTIKKNLLAAHF